MILFFLLFLALADPLQEPQSFLIENIRIVDGNGDHGIHDILITGSYIAALDPKEVSQGTKRYDGSGKTLLPGLIDSHVHITMIPGEPFLEQTQQERNERHAIDLRSYLAWGITTIVDPGITSEDVQRIRSFHPRPEIHVIGPLLGPKHGYPSVVTKLEGVSTIEEIREKIDNYEQHNPLGIKITMENGHYGSIWPLFKEELQHSIEKEIRSRSMNLYVHAMDKKMTRRALSMKPHTLVHASKDGGKKLAKEIVASGAYVISTLSIYGSPLLLWNKKLLLDGAEEKTPKEALEIMYDKRIHKQTKRAFSQVNFPAFPTWMTSWGFNSFFTKQFLGGVLKNLRIMNKEKVPLILGSDSGGWPMFTHMLHGHTTHLEIDLLEKAGLGPMEIIQASTSRPAKMLGLEDEIGVIEVGFRADLLIVQGNPLEEIQRLHKPVWVVRNGELRTANAWMKD